MQRTANDALTTPGADTSPRGDAVLHDAIRRAKEGDRDALREIYIRHVDDVKRSVKTVVRDHHDAEDVTHNVFLKLFSVIHYYEPRDVPFSAWLRRVARNAAIDFVRSAKPTVSEDRETSSGHDTAAAAERADSLRTALASLPLRQREVVTLRYVFGLSPGEIADRIGCTEASVHGLHHRGRAALKQSLRALDSQPVVRSRKKTPAAARVVAS